ncbi:MAG: cytidylate kinase-like family protein [Pseudomonadota bacterium]
MGILTISREFGSGGGEIGRMVAEAKGYEYLDKEKLLSEMSSKGGNWEKWATDFDEHCPTTWEKFDWSFRGFTALMQSALLNHAVRDNIVIMGRGANLLLKGIAHVLSIRIIAPMEERVQRIMRRESVNSQTGQWMVKKIDQERSRFLYSMYGRHAETPESYDLIINTGSRSLESVAQMVKTLLEEKEKLRTSESQGVSEIRAAAARVKAGLATDQSLFIPTLEVDNDGRNILLRGIVHNPKEQKRLEEAATKLAGGLSVKSELHYRS